MHGAKVYVIVSLQILKHISVILYRFGKFQGEDEFWVKKVVMLIEGGLTDSVFDNLFVEIKIIVDKIEQMFYSNIN